MSEKPFKLVYCDKGREFYTPAILDARVETTKEGYLKAGKGSIYCPHYDYLEWDRPSTCRNCIYLKTIEGLIRVGVPAEEKKG